NHPESDGPMAGANAITRPTVPITVPRFSTGKINKSTVIINGSTIPAPAACTIRPTINNGKLGAGTQNNVPTANIVIAVKNNLRVVNVSTKKAVIGIIIPFTSMKIVVNHCAVFSVRFKSVIIGGIAVTSNV